MELPSTILVVEDDAAIQDVLSNILRQEGFEVLTATTGNQALDLAGSNEISLVLLDLMLPDVSGSEVCRLLRNSGHATLPIVMLTALGSQDHVVAGLKQGADDYIVKPFDPSELLLRVEGLLRRSQHAIQAERALAELAEEQGEMQARADAAQVDAAMERTLRRELLHNITTHMNSLSRIADVAVRRFPAGPLREVVEQLRMRIRGASLMYDISATLQNEPVDVGELIQTIARSLKDVYRPWRRVVVEVRGPELSVSAAAASPLALIMNELITNALRHAFPEMRFGTVSVTYGEEDGHCVFTVADNGVGFDVAKPSSGRGRMAVETLVRELGGTMSWSSGSDGTRVDGQYPLAMRKQAAPRAQPA